MNEAVGTFYRERARRVSSIESFFRRLSFQLPALIAVTILFVVLCSLALPAIGQRFIEHSRTSSLLIFAGIVGALPILLVLAVTKVALWSAGRIVRDERLRRGYYEHALRFLAEGDHALDVEDALVARPTGEGQTSFWSFSLCAAAALILLSGVGMAPSEGWIAGVLRFPWLAFGLLVAALARREGVNAWAGLVLLLCSWVVTVMYCEIFIIPVHFVVHVAFLVAAVLLIRRLLRAESVPRATWQSLGTGSARLVGPGYSFDIDDAETLSVVAEAHGGWLVRARSIAGDAFSFRLQTKEEVQWLVERMGRPFDEASARPSDGEAQLRAGLHSSRSLHHVSKVAVLLALWIGFGAYAFYAIVVAVRIVPPYAAWRLGHTAELLPATRGVSELVPLGSSAWLYRGLAAAEKGLWIEAQESLERALWLSGGGGSAGRRAALAYGEKERAFLVRVLAQPQAKPASLAYLSDEAWRRYSRAKRCLVLWRELEPKNLIRSPACRNLVRKQLEMAIEASGGAFPEAQGLLDELS